MVEITSRIGAYIGIGILLGFGVFMIFAGSIIRSSNGSLLDNGWSIIWVCVILIIIKMTFDFIRDKVK